MNKIESNIELIVGKRLVCQRKEDKPNAIPFQKIQVNRNKKVLNVTHHEKILTKVKVTIMIINLDRE